MENSSFQIIDSPDPLSVCIFNCQSSSNENSNQDIYHIITIYRDSNVSRKLPLQIRFSPFSNASKKGLVCSVEMGSINGISETHTISKGSTHYIFIGLETGAYLTFLKVISNLECSPSNFRVTHFNMYNGKRLTAIRLKKCFNFIVDELEAERLVANSRYNVIVRGKDNSDFQGMITSFMTEPRNNALPYTLDTMCLKSVMNNKLTNEKNEGEGYIFG